MKLRKSIQALGTCVLMNFAVSFAFDKVDGVAAVVGDSVILTSELDAYVLMRLNAAGQKIDSTEIPKARKQFLAELIDGKILIVHAAKDTNIVVKEAEIEQALNNQVQMILQQNGISLATLEQELKTKYGMNLSKFKTQMRTQIQEQLIRQKVQQLYVSSAMQTNRKDVETFYSLYKDSLPQMGESVLLSKLTMRLSPTDSMRQIAYAKISGLKQRLDNGEDFSKLAKQYSDDPSSDSGGDLGFIKKGTLGELTFEQKAFSLNPGQTSDVFESRLGFHIISVVDRKDQMVRVKQIFVKVTPPDEFVKKITDRLDSIRTHCMDQRDFIAAVKQFSADDQSKVAHGRMGWLSLYELPELIRTAVDSLKAGEVSKPVREGVNCTLYRVDDRKAQRKLTLEDDYAVLAEKTREISAQKKLIELVRKWRQEVFVEVRL
jgi:peptidyl-prolyl cis-trans isomerase SurA